VRKGRLASCYEYYFACEIGDVSVGVEVYGLHYCADAAVAVVVCTCTVRQCMGNGDEVEPVKA
jgi:hypothetical protein